MTTWKDGGYHGDRFGHDIVNEEDGRIICRVFTKQVGDISGDSEPWPDERNFALILQAPRMLEALETIAGLAWRLKNITYKVTREDWETVEGYARAAIAAAKGEGDEDKLV